MATYCHGLLKIGHKITLYGQRSKILVVKVCPHKCLLLASVFSLFTYLSTLLHPIPNVLQVIQCPHYLFKPSVALPICQSMHHNVPKIKYIHLNSDIDPPRPLQILVIAVKGILPDIQVQSTGTTFYSCLLLCP